MLVNFSLVVALSLLVSISPSLAAQVTPSTKDVFDIARYDNQQIGKFLKIPFYFNVPFENFLPFSVTTTTVIKQNMTKKESALVVNYHESSAYEEKISPKSKLGLRLITVKGSASRMQSSSALAESQVFQAGDIVLSFRKEWFGTLKYSHVQLGVSHAGILYFEKGADGKNYLKNLDMPLDKKHVNTGYFDSEHYLGAPLLHVVRPKGLTPIQKENLNKWVVRLAKVGPTAYSEGKIRFNTDYAAPKFRPGQKLKFVGDLGRIGLSLSNDSQLTNYCSEFVWSILSLRNCNPDDVTTAQAFRNEVTPSCVVEIFQPMPVLGTVTTATNRATPGLTVGMADGIPLLSRTKFLYIEDSFRRNQALDLLLQKSGFDYADGDPQNISSGHRAVEEALLSQNPAFFKLLLHYYQMINDVGANANNEVLAMRAGFNKAQPPNYSPTSFVVHSILPNEVKAKSMDYVGTIWFAPRMNYDGRQFEVYDYLKQALLKNSR